MGNPATVPIIAPDGTLGDVPFAHMMDAIKAGGKPGVTIKSPEGTLGVVPSDRMSDAVKAGGTIVPLKDQETQHPGFWSSMWSDLKGMAEGTAKTVVNAGEAYYGNAGPLTQQAVDTAQTVSSNMQHRRDEGRSFPYRTIAPVGDVLGVNTRGMEDAADEGDVAGVLGHAAAVPVVTAASEGIARGLPPAVEAARPYFDAVKDATESTVRAARNLTPKQAAQAVGTATGAGLGHGTLSVPGAYYGAKGAGAAAESILGAERANRPMFAGKPMEQPAPFPETPAPELLQANSLSKPGAAPTPEPSAGLANIPVAPVYPGASLPEHPGIFSGAPEPTLPPEMRLPAAFQSPTPKPPAIPGTVDAPFKSLNELPIPAVQQAVKELGPDASIPALTDRANKIALGKQLDSQLSDAVGYKAPAITPGKPIYQRPTQTYAPEAPVPVPDGMTPVESSALRSYGYDPGTQTFTAQMRNSGSMYRWAEVTPDEAQAFTDAKSKGSALADIRNNHVNVAVNYGKGWINRIPNQRSASPTDLVPGAEPESAAAPSGADTGDLTALLQKSLAQVQAGGKLKSAGVENAAPEAAQTANPTASAVSAQPANRRLNPSPTVYEPRQPELPVAPGASTNIKVPGSDRSYAARYEVRELADVQPSHNGTTFQPNPKYSLTNDRDYSNPANQQKVLDASAPDKFDPSYHLTDNPDATNGPIVIDSDGHALAGNGRTMILQRVYKSNPDGAAQYKLMLANKSPQFGVDPAQVLRMKQPVLVRQIADEDLPNVGTKQEAITDFNKVGTAQLTPAERAIADSRRVSQDTLDAISAHIDAAGPDATLADALQGASGVSILNRLIDDGVIAPQEKAALATESGLTPAAKERISKLTVGRFFRDPAQMDQAPVSVRNKLEAIAAPLARVDGIAGWDLTPHVQSALDLLDEARAHNLTNLMDAVSQSRLFGDAQYSPKAIALAEQLKSGGTRALVKQLRQYAEDAQNATGTQQSFNAPMTPQQAFREAFAK